MRFVYSIVRFVPDPARGEFINVGAIVGSEESSDWQLRQIENPVRARSIDEGNRLDAVWSFLDRVGSQIDAYEMSTNQLFDADIDLSEEWLDQLHDDHRNIVQLSPPAPIVASSSEEALDRVFELVVLDPAQRRYEFQKKHTALAAVRKAYREHSIRRGQEFVERVRLETHRHTGRLDFAVLNGEVLQLTQTWSFQIPDQSGLADQVRSWGWVIQDARKSGGRVVTDERGVVEVPMSVDVEVVYVPPLPDIEAPAYEGAMDVFETLEVRYTTVDEADLVAERAEELLGSAGVGRLNLGGD